MDPNVPLDRALEILAKNLSEGIEAGNTVCALLDFLAEYKAEPNERKRIGYLLMAIGTFVISCDLPPYSENLNTNINVSDEELERHITNLTNSQTQAFKWADIRRDEIATIGKPIMSAVDDLKTSMTIADEDET